MEDEIVKGYKATDENMQCRGFQFELGVWHKHDGEIAMCESGFHFCEYPSGPWSFYSSPGTRIFKVEARGVIKGEGPGADLKHVAIEIRLVEEITQTGNGNTGNRNAGDGNAGDGNAGYRNTGDGNTGDGNVGDGNAGYRNTGDGNTGNRNAGYRNTGDGNTGYRNAGYRNTGDGNTGNGNTGNGNTGDGNAGDGNATDKCSGYLCVKEQPFVIFDEPADRDMVNFDLVYRLCDFLSKDKDFDKTPFLSIPNATEEKINILHSAHISRRARG